MLEQFSANGRVMRASRSQRGRTSNLKGTPLECLDRLSADQTFEATTGERGTSDRRG
jgi:hypothetical protein